MRASQVAKEEIQPHYLRSLSKTGWRSRRKARSSSSGLTLMRYATRESQSPRQRSDRIPPRSIMHGRKRPFSIVFDPFHINRITAIFWRIVIECKRSDTAFSHRIRSFSTVYDTVKYGPNETGQIRTVYGHKRQYTRRISAYTVTVFIDLGCALTWRSW